MKQNIKICRRVVACTVLALTAMPLAASANNLTASSIGTGIQNLVGDLSGLLLILCPSIGAIAAIYFLIRRSMADEQDGKMWTKRITISVICGFAGMLVSGLIALISSYF